VAIVSVRPTADTRQAEETFATDWTDVNIYRLSFEVVTSAPSIGGKEVLASGSLPSRGSTYSQYSDTDVLAWCRRRYAYQNPDQRTHWQVICEFSSEFVDPLNEPPIVRWNTVPAELPYMIDTADTAVLNSALDPFDPAPVRIRGYSEINITKNYEADTFDAAVWDAAKWTTNSLLFTIPFYNVDMNAGEGFLRNFSLETFRRNTIDYVRATATIWYRAETDERPNPWHDYLLDAGFRELTAAETKISILDYYGQPVTRPALLNGLGARLPLYQTGTSTPSAPVYLDFVPYVSSDWTDLDIGA
jgi:hypothetical protein